MVLNLKPISKVLCAVMAVLGAAMLLPCLVSAIYGESKEVLSFLICAVPMMLIGVLVIKLTPKEDNTVLRMRDGFFIVGVAWILMSVLGALPFVFSGAIPNFADAFFETASGFSTTGSTILSAPELLPKGMLFWRSFTHFLGGMGVLVLTIALLPMLGIGGAKIMRAETTGPTMDAMTTSINTTAKKLWFIYTGFTIVEAALLMICGMDWLDAFCNAFGTLGTGGLATHGASIAYYNSATIEMIIAFFMLFAGINFGLWYALFQGKVKNFFKDAELRTYIGIIAASTIFLAVVLTAKQTYSSIWESLRYAFFQVNTIITTTGFGTADFDLWPIPCRLVIFLLMLVGGCAGSTGGGMKVIRIMILAKMTRQGADRKLHPRRIAPLKIGGKAVNEATAYGVAGFIILYVATLVFGAFVISLSGVDTITALSASVACVSNIGPGFNLVGPSCTFAFFPGIIKIFEALLMIAGRLELYTIILLFTPQYWNKNR